MAEIKKISSQDAIEAEFANISLMGRRLAWPQFNADSFVLTGSVINGAGDLQYEVEMAFPVQVVTLRLSRDALHGAIRTPVEAGLED